MKFNIIVVIGLVLILGLFTKDAIGVSYLQMTPYLNSDCSGEELGIGASLQINECFPKGNIAFEIKNYKVSVNSDGSNATVHEFQSDDITCSNPNPSLDKTYVVGECYNTPTYGNTAQFSFNGYVHISIENNPPNIPIYGYRSTTYSDSQCSSNPQWYFYYANNTVFKNAETSETSKIYCNDGTPYEDDCLRGNCNTTYYYSGYCYRNFNVGQQHSYLFTSC